jgi:beta-phosphoglucomutase
MIRTLIFDLDGTLVDCKELHQQAFRIAVNTVCQAEVAYRDTEVEGLPTREKIKYLQARGFQLDAERVNTLKQAYTQENIHAFVKYSPELANKMRILSEKYRLCVASNATQEFVYRALDILQIIRYFSLINTATQYPAKPDPLTFVDCMTACGSSPYNTVIFEDSEVGLTAARKVVVKQNVIAVDNAQDLLNKLKDF